MTSGLCGPFPRPGPKLAIRYITPPIPVITPPSAASEICRAGVSNTGNYGIDRSRANVIMIIFSTVPKPCF